MTELRLTKRKKQYILNHIYVQSSTEILKSKNEAEPGFFNVPIIFFGIHSIGVECTYKSKHCFSCFAVTKTQFDQSIKGILLEICFMWPSPKRKTRSFLNL